MEPRRLRVPFDRSGEDLGRRLERAQLQQIVPPIEQVLLGRRPCAQHADTPRPRPRDCPRRSSMSPRRLWSSPVSFRVSVRVACSRAVGQLACLEQDEGEVVAVGVLRRVDRLRALKVRKRRVRPCRCVDRKMPAPDAPRSCRAAGGRSRAGVARGPRTPQGPWTMLRGRRGLRGRDASRPARRRERQREDDGRPGRDVTASTRRGCRLRPHDLQPVSPFTKLGSYQ